MARSAVGDANCDRLAERRVAVARFRARVFDEKLRDLAREINVVAKEALKASSLNKAKDLNDRLRQQHECFNDSVANVLPELY